MVATKKRRDQYTCKCYAYKFPHRFGGGKCNGFYLAADHWGTFFGWDHICQRCPALTIEDGAGPLCDVLHGGEHPNQCEIVMEFKHANSIPEPKTKKPKRP